MSGKPLSLSFFLWYSEEPGVQVTNSPEPGWERGAGHNMTGKGAQFLQQAILHKGMIRPLFSFLPGRICCVTVSEAAKLMLLDLDISWWNSAFAKGLKSPREQAKLNQVLRPQNPGFSQKMQIASILNSWFWPRTSASCPLLGSLPNNPHFSLHASTWTCLLYTSPSPRD